MAQWRQEVFKATPRKDDFVDLERGEGDGGLRTLRVKGGMKTQFCLH